MMADFRLGCWWSLGREDSQQEESKRDSKALQDSDLSQRRSGGVRLSKGRSAELFQQERRDGQAGPTEAFASRNCWRGMMHPMSLRLGRANTSDLSSSTSPF